MLQRLQIAFAKVKVGYTSKKLLNEINKTIHILFLERKRNYEKRI